MTTTKIATLLALVMLISPCITWGQVNEDKPLRNFQLSIIPLLGTDGSQAIDYRYQISLNLLGGLNGGVQGVELGGFMNINQGRVEGLQLAGFGNLINGSFQGIQASGFVNVINGDSKGLNFSGFLNAVRGDQEGVAGSGFLNAINGNGRGVAGAGFMNVTRHSFQGVSGSGFMNVAGGEMDGVHGAGFMNVALEGSSGVYGAGFANVSGGKAKGIFAAGFMNAANDFEGMQIAGFLNIAKAVEGVQLGFINISDTISGVPIGFLSIVKRGGLMQLELGASDALLMNASFKIGVPVFYNIFTIGFTPHFSALGYGVGTRINLGYPSWLNLEAHSSQLYRNRNEWRYQHDNRLNEFRTIYTHSFSPRLQVFAGATLNHQMFRLTNDQQAEDMAISSWVLYESTFRDWTSQWWIGGRAGVNFVIR